MITLHIKQAPKITAKLVRFDVSHENLFSYSASFLLMVSYPYINDVKFTLIANLNQIKW